MKRKTGFATNNAHKLEEVSHILSHQIELLSLKDIACDTQIYLRQPIRSKATLI